MARAPVDAVAVERRSMTGGVFSRLALEPAVTGRYRGVALLVLLAACSRPPAALTPVSMAVGGQAQFIYLPLTLADQLGYFKDEGLAVIISDLRGGSEALAALMGGSVDMVTGFYEHTIRAQAQGKRLVMITL